MTFRTWIEDPRARLDVVAGLIDGILNALVLASGRLLKAGEIDASLTVRVALATGLTTLFVFFMAHYAELRAELFRAEKELSVLAHGRLAASRLGRQAVRSAVGGAAVAAICGICGSSIPLLMCEWLPGPRWMGIAVAIGMLAALGALLAKSFRGSALFWAATLAGGGVALTVIGLKIDLAG